MATPATLDPRLSESYEFCRYLHRVHGRTFYLATRLLPAWKRRHVHALYGFTRHTDDIVDDMAAWAPSARAARLHHWIGRFSDALDGEWVDDAVLPALLHTIQTFELDRADFRAFLRSMEMDLAITTYDSYDDLLDYMDGSAAAIGSMMLPILGVGAGVDLATAREPARQLGIAFQLTNFIRDVEEDLDRGRIYLPLKDLAEHGVTPDDLASRATTPPIRALIAFEIDRARRHYALAAPGIPMLEPRSQACIRAAFRVYGAILDEVERADYNVFGRRATVGNPRRLRLTVASALTRPGRAVRL
jgi:phytoene synthase